MLEAKQLGFSYPQSHTFEFKSFTIEQGQSTLIQGASGSGKTTLLNLLSGISPIQQGQLTIMEQPLHSLSLRKRDQFRADHLGYVFQQFNLITYLSVLNNILLPLSYSTVRKNKALQKGMALDQVAENYATALGLDASLLHQKAGHLSQGQQQRVAFARSMIGTPSYILADEPTSSLDPKNTDRLMQLLLQECKAHGMTLVMVSHDPSLARYFDQTLQLESLLIKQAS